VVGLLYNENLKNIKTAQTMPVPRRQKSPVPAGEIAGGEGIDLSQQMEHLCVSIQKRGIDFTPWIWVYKVFLI
jgi:hypothetical protein